MSHAILCVAAGLLFAFYLDRTTFVLLLILLLLPVASYALVRYQSGRIQAGIRFEKNRTRITETAKLFIKVKNDTFMPLIKCRLDVGITNAFVDKEEDMTMDFFVLPFSEREVAFELSSPVGTRIIAQTTTIELKDYMGFFKARKIDVPDQAVCMLLPVKDMAYADDMQGKSDNDDSMEQRTIIGEDVSEVADIRQFRPADRMSRIHWKLTTKMDEFMVKEFALEYGTKTTLVFELTSANGYERLDAVLKAVYEFALALCDMGREFNIRWFDYRTNEQVNVKIETSENVDDCFEKIYSCPLYENRLFMYNVLKGEDETRFLYVAPEADLIKIEHEQIASREGVSLSWV